VTKPDLIELSTDWHAALAVADRYTGVGNGADPVIARGRDVFAAFLLIANNEGRGYRWVGEMLGGDGYPDVSALIDATPEPSAEVMHAFRMLRTVLSAKDIERYSSFATANELFAKALQPRSVLDPSFDDESAE
jgi:hypothetical protein